MTDPGLCGTCAHARRLDTARSTYLLCELSKTQPERYPRYPRLPVVACREHAPLGLP